mmetsp:Transcript_10339/g.26459  ORF Transcript_10339/g.26459 Transcript_10339/m.26459 type:complete len:201 (-) Transcript_10339:257-859(-)
MRILRGRSNDKACLRRNSRLHRADVSFLRLGIGRNPHHLDVQVMSRLGERRVCCGGQDAFGVGDAANVLGVITSHLDRHQNRLGPPRRHRSNHAVNTTRHMLAHGYHLNLHLPERRKRCWIECVEIAEHGGRLVRHFVDRPVSWCVHVGKRLPFGWVDIVPFELDQLLQNGVLWNAIRRGRPVPGDGSTLHHVGHGSSHF